MTPLFDLARSDCERTGAGLLAQPVNTVSSLTYLLVGLWILGLSARSPGRRVELAVFGVAVALNAVGGLAFHGVQAWGARWIHDVSIVAVLGFVVAFGVARLLDRPTRWTMTAFGIGLAALGAVIALWPGTVQGLSGVLAVAAGATEVVEYRHEMPGLRREGFSARRLARLSVLAVLGLASAAFLVGRTDAWLCNPDSTFQWHAIWHALSAAAMGLYAYGAIEPHPAPPASAARAA
ncbi:MAG TPA: ceramidase domain-containing protein [Actinomycetota bacterium]|nr:ceramidase domain-containing protein [Actinomycetota bacterium]